jgi:hypothetical protein
MRRDSEFDNRLPDGRQITGFLVTLTVMLCSWSANLSPDDSTRDPIARLVCEIGRAAQAGWAQTARMMALLAVAAAAVALVLMTR